MKIRVEWDFSSTDLEEIPYEEAIRFSGLPEIITVPSDVDDDDVSDWLSDEYDYLVLDWDEVQ